MSENKYFVSRENILKNHEKFIKQILFSSTQIITNDSFEEVGIKNRNLMFFLNYITENLSSVSMLGCRNLNVSLLGKISKFIDYYENINLQFEIKDKIPKIPKYKIDYIRTSIKKCKFISEESRKKYMCFLHECDDSEFVENLKLIRESLIRGKYFETVSDNLYELIQQSNFDNASYDRISELSSEYFSLLIDYIGISTFEIKKIIRDTYREFFSSSNENCFIDLFSNFAESYNKYNKYYVIIKMDKEFDEKLLTSLKQSGNNNYIIYSKSGLIKMLNELKINNNRIFKKICDSELDIELDNNYYLSSEIESKDIWQAIKEFKQKTVQPFIGSMLYSGIRVNTSGKYYVVECKNNKKFFNEYNFFDDVFKPLTQDRIDYSDVFKRYIIENSENSINKIIDEAVQLLPYYKNSESILTKFTNTWFALETLFRNAGDCISKSFEEYASCLVADRMISGYIFVNAIQIKKAYKGFDKLSNNFIENIYMNYDKNNPNDCDFLLWKREKMNDIVNDYELIFSDYYLEAKELLMDAYYLRNKQFHGNKDSQMEATSGYIYDIVNDTISFYIDYIDVFRNSDKNLTSLFNFIKNIKTIKSFLISEESIFYDKISIIYDSVRKI